MTEASVVKKPARKASAPKAKTSPKSLSSSNLFAVFATGGKQYNVKVGNKVKILLIDGDTSDIKLGTPFIAGATVTATLNKIARYKTIDVIKYKQKSRYFKKYGHRQPYFEIEITSIK
ncbi:MAG: 50S ribosomal protein L21 [Candidatus Zambryskibacteria bacterium]|nr:50S ribosomal protein L21 [Candidatus Zambryskibacteria bacterium]